MNRRWKQRDRALLWYRVRAVVHFLIRLAVCSIGAALALVSLVHYAEPDPPFAAIWAILLGALAAEVALIWTVESS